MRVNINSLPVLGVVLFLNLKQLVRALFLGITFFTTTLVWSEQIQLSKAGYSTIDLTELLTVRSKSVELRPLQRSASPVKVAKPYAVKPSIMYDSNFSQSGIFPSLRYVGRSALDPLGVLGSNEVTLVESQFPQRGIERWGDYSAMTLDPVDDCTFWYTGSYVGSNQSTILSIGTWSTRIASFQFPECGSPFDTTIQNFDGIEFTGSFPPDPVGDIGLNYYIQMTNSPTGAVFSIYSKQDGSHIVGPLELASLWQGEEDCKNGRGDPIVVWDQFANRWVMMELGRNLRSLCIYVSISDDPISGGWNHYQVDTPNFPDYPKMAVYADTQGRGAYLITTSEPENAVYILNREDMLSGKDAAISRLTVPRLPGYVFQALTPADVEGRQALKPGTPAYLLRHFDDEVHAQNTALEDFDFIELWSVDLGFETKSNVRISGLDRIPLADFETELCGTVSTGCFGQASTGTKLDPLFEVVMWRVTHRNLGEEQVLLGNFTVDASGNDQGGIQWFDLRKEDLGLWQLFQQGTWAPDNANRWMGSIAMDNFENIALGYSVSAADPPIIDQNEINNTFSTASNISCGIQNHTGLVSSNDVDYYLLNGVPGLTVTIDIDAAVDHSSLNSLLGVFDTSFQLLQTNETGQAVGEILVSEDSFLIQSIPEDGRLYIAVTSSGDSNFVGKNGRSTGFYRLSVACVEAQTDQFEPNNSFLTAADVTCPIETLDTSIGTPFDIDYFRFKLLQPGEFVEFDVNTSHSMLPIDLLLRVFDSTGQLVAESNPSNESLGMDPFLRLQSPDDGVFYVLVAASDLNSTGEYALNCRQ